MHYLPRGVGWLSKECFITNRVMQYRNALLVYTIPLSLLDESIADDKVCGGVNKVMHDFLWKDFEWNLMTVITKTFSFSRADSTGKAGQFVRPFLLLPCRYIFCHDINVDILIFIVRETECQIEICFSKCKLHLLQAVKWRVFDIILS